jgi:hypothetical protein
MGKKLLITALRLMVSSLFALVMLWGAFPPQLIIGPSFIIGAFLTILVEILRELEHLAKPFKEMMEDDGEEEYND